MPKYHWKSNLFRVNNILGILRSWREKRNSIRQVFLEGDCDPRLHLSTQFLSLTLLYSKIQRYFRWDGVKCQFRPGATELDTQELRRSSRIIFCQTWMRFPVSNSISILVHQFSNRILKNNLHDHLVPPTFWQLAQPEVRIHSFEISSIWPQNKSRSRKS